GPALPDYPLEGGVIGGLAELASLRHAASLIPDHTPSNGLPSFPRPQAPALAESVRQGLTA
ncbi:MAG: hypothetical protein AB8C46_03910, partial [Burkholderiaceae bacterium]